MILQQYICHPKEFPNLANSPNHPVIRQIKTHSGYFSKSESPEELTSYAQMQVDCLSSADILTYGNGSIINLINKSHAKQPNHILDDCEDSSSVGFAKTINSLTADNPDMIFVPFDFIEALDPFMASFDKWASNKTILMVSPFPKTFSVQNKRRHLLFQDYKFPNFKLKVCKSPMTLNTTFSDIEGNTETSCWHDELNLMLEKISAVDFDVALLSCGSYATPAAHFIKTKLGKKAIYMGGPALPMFNIDSKRYRIYNTPFYKNRSLRYMLSVVEQGSYSYLKKMKKVTRELEGYDAYFTPTESTFLFQKF